jgi:hypothetical protein
MLIEMQAGRSGFTDRSSKRDLLSPALRAKAGVFSFECLAVQTAIKKSTPKLFVWVAQQCLKAVV